MGKNVFWSFTAELTFQSLLGSSSLSNPNSYCISFHHLILQEGGASWGWESFKAMNHVAEGRQNFQVTLFIECGRCYYSWQSELSISQKTFLFADYKPKRARMGTAGKVRKTFQLSYSLVLIMGAASESFECRRIAKYLRLFLEEGKAVVWAHMGCVGKWRQNANSKQQDLIENHMQKVLLEGSEEKKRNCGLYGHYS